MLLPHIQFNQSITVRVLPNIDMDYSPFMKHALKHRISVIRFLYQRCVIRVHLCSCSPSSSLFEIWHNSWPHHPSLIYSNTIDSVYFLSVIQKIADTRRSRWVSKRLGNVKEPLRAFKLMNSLPRGRNSGTN